jgi:hypothetical protein
MAQFLTSLTRTRLDGEFSHGRPVYTLLDQLSYKSDLLYDEFDSNFNKLFHNEGIVVVPKGYQTDLASIPWPYSLVLKPNGPWERAAVVHDWLCSRSRKEEWANFGVNYRLADAVFHEAMKTDGVHTVFASVFWFYVRLFHMIKTPLENQ